MDVYTTEEQQIEAIKKWWQTNGNSVLIGIALAIAAVLGYQYWTQNEQANSEAAAVLYGQVVEAANQAEQNRLQGNNAELEGQLATLNHLGEQLKSDFASSEYAVFGALMLAKQAVMEGKPEAAETQLRWAMEHTVSDATRLIANLRLARVLAARGQYDAALQALDAVEPGVQGDAYEEVRGDIYVAMGEQDKARDAYKKAMDLSADRNEGQSRPILKFKYDNLLVAGN
ncbi:YfgM family protein [Ketobacter sp.]|uniref:YfgM family protein n=1 Tax=Ketobacter sp. TaxID=2083498 RepID=UPI000F0F991C|nr:tetratricopeptide repeat protein [Ketobacter sp.]RLT95344.1 MAG: hypothetical protein D9N14_14865 [Ketobacter sp.]